MSASKFNSREVQRSALSHNQLLKFTCLLLGEPPLWFPAVYVLTPIQIVVKSAAFYAPKLSAAALCYHVNGARVVAMGKRKYVVESWSGRGRKERGTRLTDGDGLYPALFSSQEVQLSRETAARHTQDRLFGRTVAKDSSGRFIILVCRAMVACIAIVITHDSGP
ncbi:hypothetical protein Ddc_06327 [Ditylenchus destructor]|nr:hypothetical protein Ddc_06327 [Ditylenchus destructor]